MTSIGTRMLDATVTALKFSLPVATWGAAIGGVYAIIAGLPPSAVAKAGAIWAVAEGTLYFLAEAITEHRGAQALLRITAVVVPTTLGIQEMRKRNLLGDKMIYFIIGLQALAIVGILSDALEKKPTEQPEIQ